jgi:hypothetical protein
VRQTLWLEIELTQLAVPSLNCCFTYRPRFGELIRGPAVPDINPRRKAQPARSWAHAVILLLGRLMPFPLPAIDVQPATTISTMYLPWQSQGRRRLHCRWVEVTQKGMGCLCPQCLYGQASELRTCCSYEREPGSDDELPTCCAPVPRGTVRCFAWHATAASMRVKYCREHPTNVASQVKSC